MMCKQKVVDTLITKHQLACKRANSHCIYSKGVYEGSCIKCFALWHLNTYVKAGQDNDALADELVTKHKADCKQLNCKYTDKTYEEACIKCFAMSLDLQDIEEVNNSGQENKVL